MGWRASRTSPGCSRRTAWRSPSTSPSRARRTACPRCCKARSSTWRWASRRCPWRHSSGSSISTPTAAPPSPYPSPSSRRGGRSFSGLARFAPALLEGDTLSYKPRLSRVYLSSLTPEARASGTLSVVAEASANDALRRLYLQTHLRRAAAIAAVFCLPVLAAYVHFYMLLDKAQDEVQQLEDTVSQLREQGIEGRGEVVEDLVNRAAEALLHLKRAERWWPPLSTSFPEETLALRQRLANGIRESDLRA